MSQLDSFKDTFFAECEDLLEALTEGLRSMTEGATDSDTVNAVFRSAHSIKGAAGAFGFDELVSFAHAFETVLDEIRSGRLEPTPDTLRLLMRAGDVLADLVEAARTPGTQRPASADQILASLIELHPKTEEVEFSFDAVAVPLAIEVPAETYLVNFAPHAALFQNGHEPELLFSALGDLGPMSVTCDSSALPEFEAMNADECYLRWVATLETSASTDAIAEVFAFVEGLCDLAIIRQEPEPAPAPIAVVAEAAPVQPTVRNAPNPTLRVDLDRVERLINSVGELIINQASLSQKIVDSGAGQMTEVHADLEDYKHLARDIQEAVMAIRAQPVRPLFQRMSRIVRDAADATGKQIEFVTDGASTEVDKTVVEKLAEPLTHMIRNAIDHGIEKPEDRIAKGKPAAGTVKLSASHRSGSVLIEITDDGAGLNRSRILQTAIKKGLVAENAKLTEAEIDNILFMPGFSTASAVTNLSGRGVGMDVVKTEITALGGRISITSKPDQGSVFTIALPLTLAVLDGMIVTVDSQTMVVPISAVVETIRPSRGDISQIGKRGHLLSIRGTFVPIIDLGNFFNNSTPAAPSDTILLLVRTKSNEQCALAVQDITDQRQVVIKSLQGNYGDIPGISAATILGNGQIALIIDPDAIVAKSQGLPVNQN